MAIHSPRNLHIHHSLHPLLPTPFSRHALPFLVFATVSLIVGIWFNNRLPIGYGDTGVIAFFPNPSYLLQTFSHTWASTIATGYPSGQHVTLLPLTFLFAILQFLNLPTFLRQALVYYLLMFSAMAAMYQFTLRLFPHHNHSRLLAFSAAIFYALNPLVMINYWYNGTLSLYLLPAIPALLLSLHNAIKRPCLYSYVLFAITISLFSVIFLNPAFAIPLFLLLLSYWLFATFHYRSSTTDPLSPFYSAIKCLIIFILINSWFLLPLLATSQSYYRGIARMDPLQTLEVASRSTSMTALLRLLPLRPDSAVWAYKNPEWRLIYNTWPFVLLGFFLTALALATLIRQSIDARIIFLVFILIIGLFLCLGVNQPLGGAFRYLFEHVPLAPAFRSPTNKFLPFVFIPLSILFAVGANSLSDCLKRSFCWFPRNVALLGVLALGSGLYVFPMWTGAAVTGPVTIRGNEISSYVDIPRYYDAAAQYFEEKQLETEFRVIALPLRPSTYVGHSWPSGYDGPDYTWLLLRTRTFSYLMDNYLAGGALLSAFAGNILERTGGVQEEKIVEREAVGSPDSTSLIRMAGLVGARYIVVQGDVDPVHGNYNGEVLMDQGSIRSLVGAAGLDQVASFGELEIYEVPDGYVVPMIYGAHAAIKQVKSIAELAEVLSDPSYRAAEQAFALDSVSELGCPGPRWAGSDNRSGPPDEVKFRRVSPVRWEVMIRGAKGPFLLILSESFDPGWKAFVVPMRAVGSDSALVHEARGGFGGGGIERFMRWDLQSVFRAAVDEGRHFCVNGFANAWLLDPEEIDSESVLVVLYYVPQRWFVVGIAVSALSLLSCGAYLGVRLLVRKRAIRSWIRMT
jgi:hypothetical protein